MVDQRFLPKYHLRHNLEFQRAYRRRCSASDAVLVVFGYPNDLAYSRLGLSVSRKVGKAVVRNRWKRLIREAFRLNREQLPTGLDLITIPRQGVEPQLHEVSQSLRWLAHRVAGKLTKARR
jgi:ribonuclease P protein component